MAIAEGIAAAKSAMDVGTKVIDLLRHPKIDGEAVRNSIIEMQDLIFSAQRALGDAEDENRRLRHQLEDREELKTIADDLEYQEDGGYYLRMSERAKGSTIPYCPVCWNIERKTIPLVRVGVYYSLHCGQCKADYHTNEIREKLTAPIWHRPR